jgi:hypothetical protein
MASITQPQPAKAAEVAATCKRALAAAAALINLPIREARLQPAPAH